MIQSYHHGRFEFFVSLIVISIIALAALGRYAFMAEETRILRLEVLSHHFMTGAANTRVEFLMQTVANKSPLAQQYLTTANNQTVYFSAQGWPVSVTARVSADSQADHQITDDDCYELWQLFLQNPPPIAKGLSAKPKGEYRAFTQQDRCRYQSEGGEAYFDYLPSSGRVFFVPERS